MAATLGPQIWGGAPLIDIATAAMLMVLIYAAVALGIVQGYFFDVDRWAWTLLLSAVTLLVIVLTEAAMAIGLDLDKGPAASLAFVVVGSGWLLARHQLLDRLIRRRRDDGQLIGRAHHIVLAATPAERSARWRDALQTVFQPLEMMP